MTTLECKKQGLRYSGFTLKGHSDFSKSGTDIVCAAVSALSITCCNALEKIANVKPFIKQKDGYLELRLDNDQLSHETDIILSVLELGIRDIAKHYPKHVKIID